MRGPAHCTVTHRATNVLVESVINTFASHTDDWGSIPSHGNRFGLMQFYLAALSLSFRRSSMFMKIIAWVPQVNACRPLNHGVMANAFFSGSKMTRVHTDLGFRLRPPMLQ